MLRDHIENYSDILPEGSLPIVGFRLLSYIAPDGKTCYRFAQVGDVAVSQLVGLLEMAKIDLATAGMTLRDSRRSQDEGEGDE